MSDGDGGEDDHARARGVREAEREAICAPETVQNTRRTLAFLAAIQHRICVERRITVVDLRPIRRISLEGCLLLTAELERCAVIGGGDLYGYLPEHPGVCRSLETFGFYSHLKIDTPVQLTRRGLRRPVKDTILVKSGNRDDIKSKLNDIAAVTTELFGDSAYAEAVEIALQEAMTNVMSHAFDEAGREARLPGRWWFAGRIDRRRGEAVFYALDHGAGIPARAPKTMGEEIAEYWSRHPDPPARMRDRHVLQATIGARKAGIVGRHNNGLPTMVGLVETDSRAGAVNIYSRQAAYAFSKKVGENGHPVPAERCYGQHQPFPGTLVVWRLAGPAVAVRGH